MNFSSKFQLNILNILIICLILFGYQTNFKQTYGEIICKGPTFTYKDRYEWPILFPGCSGDRQSPINIDSRLANCAPFSLVLTNYLLAYNLIARNNGDLAQLTINDDDDDTIGSAANNLPYIQTSYTGDTRYQLNNIQFHWGQNDDQGSEHCIDDKFAAAEIIFVHNNQNYDNFDDALTHRDGLLVVSTMLDLQDNDNLDLQPFIDVLPYIVEFNTTAPIDSAHTVPFYLGRLMPQDKQSMYLYEGCISHPPCHQAATWFIFSKRIGISREQLSKFRQLKWEPIGDQQSTRILDNRRPLQPINGRTVYRSDAYGCKNFVDSNTIPLKKHYTYHQSQPCNNWYKCGQLCCQPGYYCQSDLNGSQFDCISSC
ncbi:carbonic anhydrase 1-like [Oppia nitens]|uniref:carbonic anhydrase 1-like n=1 Tax=Oppia nitens TaxID=1686743 RepID=UPI0023DA922A|nr:carbonic anhydrase 1-like [Oppia nitens]